MEKLDIKPPSDDYELIIGDGDWIIPDGAKASSFPEGIDGRIRIFWWDSSHIGEISVPDILYAVPKWVDLKVGDVLPQGYEYRSRIPNRRWTTGESEIIGLELTDPDCSYSEYRAPAPPLRRMSDTVDSLKTEIAKLKQENDQLAEKAENWRKLYLERKARVEELKQEVAETYEKYVVKGDAELREARKEVAKLRTVILAKPVLEMALREILQEAINSTDFDPEA